MPRKIKQWRGKKGKSFFFFSSFFTTCSKKDPCQSGKLHLLLLFCFVCCFLGLFFCCFFSIFGNREGRGESTARTNN